MKYQTIHTCPIGTKAPEQKAARCDWLLERFQSMSVQMDGTACWLFQNYELKRARSVEEAIDKAMGVWK